MTTPTLTTDQVATLMDILDCGDLVDCPEPLMAMIQAAGAEQLRDMRALVQLVTRGHQPANAAISLHHSRSYVAGNAELVVSHPGDVAIRLAGSLLSLRDDEALALIDLARILSDAQVAADLHHTIGRRAG